MKRLLFACCFLISIRSHVGLACTAVDAKELRLKPPAHIIFFASWCSSCKASLKADRLGTSYFVALFDEQEAAKKAFLAYLDATALDRCFWDKDGSVAKAYGVKALPAERAFAP